MKEKRVELTPEEISGCYKNFDRNCADIIRMGTIADRIDHRMGVIIMPFCLLGLATRFFVSGRSELCYAFLVALAAWVLSTPLSVGLQRKRLIARHYR